MNIQWFRDDDPKPAVDQMVVIQREDGETTLGVWNGEEWGRLTIMNRSFPIPFHAVSDVVGWKPL